MNIYIRVEVLARELQGRLLLALVAADRGHHVVLLDKPTAYELFHPRRRPSLPLGVYHDNTPGNSHGGKTELHERLAADGFIVSSQDEEPGLNTDDFVALRGGSYPRRAVASKAALFAFGPYDADGLAQTLPEHRDRIFPTGSPRVDFWRPEFDRYFSEIPHPLGDDVRPYIVVTTSQSPFFTHGPDHLPLEDAGSDLSDLLSRIEALRTQGEDASVISDYRVVAHVKVAVERIARSHPDHLVVVRPHPHERPRAWTSVFDRSLPNIRVIRDNAVSPWIRRAACVVVSGSTVAFEAAASGTPLITFVPEGLPITPAASRMGHRAVTIDDVTELTDAILRDGTAAMDPERSAVMTRTLKERFFATDGRLAADRIVDTWEQLAPPAVASATPVNHSLLGVDRSPVGLLRAARRRLGSLTATPDARARARWDRDEHDLKFPPFDLAQIGTIHRGLVATLERFDRVSIRPIGPRVLLIGPQ